MAFLLVLMIPYRFLTGWIWIHLLAFFLLGLVVLAATRGRLGLTPRGSGDRSSRR